MDRAAYAQMLRSPFTGLSIQALAICLASLEAPLLETPSLEAPSLEAPSRETVPPKVPFSDEPLSLLGEEDKEKYRHGQRIYQKILKSACTESISSMVSELWFGEGYRYETEWNPETAVYREMYDYLFHLAALADENNHGLAAFTDYIHELYKTGGFLDDIEIPLDRPGARSSAVHLMTVHKSKGLEFPVVFLCCCDKKSRNEYSGEIFDTGNSGLTFNPPLPPEYENIKDVKRNYFWERSLAEERAKRTAELRRLLYVGMTRAEKELFLSGCLKIGKESDMEGESPPEQNNGDFSQELKRYIDNQLATTKGINAIKGDTIMDNDTFFGLCLPAFGTQIQQKSTESPAAVNDLQTPFFTVEKIPVYTDRQGREQKGDRFPNNQKGLNDFFKITGPFYDRATTIETPIVPKKHFSPTTSEALPFLTSNSLPSSFITDKVFSGEDATDVFKNVDSLLTYYSKQQGEDNEKFNSGSFGTIAHICVEALLSSMVPIIPPKLAGFLRPTDADALLDAGKELALRFARSPLGIVAKGSKGRKSEFPFRTLAYSGENEIFINGVIDLVFEDSQTVYVVDFKTDAQELPGEHITQMACYYRAASDLFSINAGKECRIWLYYLRSGHAVEVTRQVMQNE
jgi:ATP-dependent helicase/nuclease subunit A